MRGIEVADCNLILVGKDVVLDISVHIEVPNEVEHKYIAGELVDRLVGLIGANGSGMDHIRPHHRFKSLFCNMIVKSGYVLCVNIRGVFFTASLANADLIYFVVTDVNVLFRLDEVNDLIDKVEYNIVAFFKRGAVAMTVCRRRARVLCSRVLNDNVNLFDFCKLGVSDGYVLNVSK